MNGNSWQRFEAEIPILSGILWFAESRHVKYAQVVFTLGATGDLDLDNVQFQRYERTMKQ